MSSKKKKALLYYSVLKRSVKSEVARSTKTHLSELVLNNRDLALNSCVNFTRENGYKHQQREWEKKAPCGRQGRITTNADECLPSEAKPTIG